MPALCDRDENGWLIPQEGTKSRKIYDLAVAGMPARYIQKALPELSKNNIEVVLWRIRNPQTRNAFENRYRKGKRGLTYKCTECGRPYIHDNNFDWAYWERYEDGSFICPTCRGVDVAAERRKLLGRDD